MELRKSLDTIGVFSLGAGAMISSGLFILPALAFSEAGPWGVLAAYAVAGLGMLPAIFSKLELTSAIPRSGGAFFYLARIFGGGVGTVAGLADWFSIALKSAFALVGIGLFGSLVAPGLGEGEFKLIALGALVLFTLVNVLSVEGTGRFQVAMVVALLAILVAYIVVGYSSMDFVHFSASSFPGAKAMLSVTAMVFISYGGITKIAAAVEEVRDAKRMLVPGMLAAFLVVQVVYLLAVFVTVGAMDGARLSSSVSPLTDAASGFFASPALSEVAVVAVAAAGLLAFFTTANAGILSASRVPMAMARDGLLPAFLGKVSRKGTPVPAILATSGFMAAVILGLGAKELAKVASLFLLLVFALENLGLVLMRASRMANYRPIFRSPLFPAMQIAGIVLYLSLIASTGLVPLVIAAVFVVAALAWYLAWGRRGWNRTSALLTMTRRLSEPDFGSTVNDLEDELLEVLMERDNIVEDRFDRLVKESAVIDYDRTVDREELFRDVGDLFGDRLRMDGAALARRFAARENEASTIIDPGVAVPHALPHVVLEGESLFDLVLVRNRFGIKWGGDEVVYTAFCMVGSRDERTFHLKALMSIAQSLQDPAFVKAWSEARTERELRTALVLARRKRFPDGGTELPAKESPLG